MRYKTMNISLPGDLVKMMDAAAIAQFTTRSDYIRQAILQKLHADQARRNEWEQILDRYAPASEPNQVEPMQEESDAKSNEIFRMAGFENFEEFIKDVDRLRD